MTEEKRQKILYVITKGSWGGAQRYVFDVATHLPQSEFDVEVVLGGEGLLKERLQANSIKVISLPELQRDISLIKEVRSFLSLLKIFRKSRPNIVHLNSSKAGVLGAIAARLLSFFSFLEPTAYRLKPKIVFTAHGWPFNEERGWFRKSLLWLASYITALLATEIIVITSLDFEQAKAMPFVAHKTRLIFNGIKVPEFLSRDEAREKLGLQRDDLVVGSIGELTRNKNYPELVTVVAKLLGKGLTFELAIIGEGEDRTEITSRMKSGSIPEGHVTLLGFKQDAYTYLKAFDIFALNSLKEGLPYVLLEAGLAGLPVVATSVGGIPDIIENGQTGLLVPPFHMDEALQKLLTEKETREKLGSALKERIREAFSFERMLTETLEIYGYTRS
ncbi:MAG: glycosyltransferase family 4 protein [bacterium]|nr:glycosyltransferase family 4 protein [bacterium]